MAGFICCNCGRGLEIAEYGTTLAGRYLDSITDDEGTGQLVFCRECWEKIKTVVKVGMAEGLFLKGACAIRCVTCEGVIPIIDDTLQGTLVAGGHDNPVTGCGGAIRVPFCPECWKRITRNIEADNVVVQDVF